MPDTIITGLSTRSRRPVQSTGAWTCPTCGAEQVTPLEHGCPACGAGQDGVKARPATGAPRLADVSVKSILDPTLVNMDAFHEAIEDLAQAEKTEGALAMYAVYRDSLKRIPMRQEEMVRASFLAGAVWMREKLKLQGLLGGGTPAPSPQAAGEAGSGADTPEHPVPEPAPVAVVESVPVEHGEGSLLVLIDADGALLGPLDLPAHQTIVAALVFYVESQLAYGEIPGQLTADATRDLIRRLLPKETA